MSDGVCGSHNHNDPFYGREKKWSSIPWAHGGPPKSTTYAEQHYEVALVAVSFAMMASYVESSVHSIQQRPNILLLLTDDQDVVLGGADHMPFLDQHVRHQGSTFHNFFVHTATCCPSRSSILSGRYLHNIGVLNNSLEGNCDGPSWQSKVESHTLAIYAKQAGYRTGYAGKYLNTYGHDGTNRVPAGWDKWLAIVGTEW